MSLFFSVIFLISISFAESKNENLTSITQALKLASDNQTIEASQQIEKWNPTEKFQQDYKLFFSRLWSSNIDQIWSFYKELKKNKKLLRLRVELFTAVIQLTSSQNEEVRNLKNQEIKKEAQVILKQLKGTSEGEQLESAYLKWILNNKNFDVVCSSERKRWINQPDLNFNEVVLGVAKCPMDIEDFLQRLRRLIFNAREKQASEEIETFFKINADLVDWQKAYIRAIFDSNTGDPLKALQSLAPFEKKLIESDYNNNYFFISQRAGQFEKSVFILDQIEISNKISKKMNKKQIDELQFQRGFLYYQNGQYEQANKIFTNLVTSVKKSKRKYYSSYNEQLFWLQAWTSYLKKDFEKAQMQLTQMKDLTSDSSRLNYWLAMVYLQTNQVVLAGQIFKKLSENVVNNETFTFYQFLSWIRFQSLKKSNKDLLSQLFIKDLLNLTRDKNAFFPIPDEFISRSEVIEMYNFILNDSTSSDEQNVILSVNDENKIIESESESKVEISSDAELKKHLNWAQFLIDNKQSELAKWHLFDLEKSLKIASQKKLLLQFYTQNSFYYRSLSLGQRAFLKNPMSFADDEVILKTQYPKAYEASLNKFTSLQNIDPYFQWSIMKAETQFKSDAISPVGAVGLMQFMPYTLEKLNKLIEQNATPNDLFEPDKSIEFGAAYLSKLSFEFEDFKPFVAAGYNGGPHRVKAWLSQWGQPDFDVFVEHIPFAETRTYVKRVLTFNASYEKLYQKKLNFEQYEYLIKKQPLLISRPTELREEWDPGKLKPKKSKIEK